MIPLRCGLCDHKWEASVTLPMEVARFVDFARGLVNRGCPKCGGNGENIGIRTRWEAGGE